MKWKPGDVVIFDCPDFPPEVITLKELCYNWSFPVWEIEENDYYLYQEKFFRKLTKLDKVLK